MSSLLLKNINLINIIDINSKLLTIKELLKHVNYDINSIYIDQFWDNIEHDKWIYIDNELILWLDYKDIKRGKEFIIRILKQYFKESDDYKILNNSEFVLEDFCSTFKVEQNINEEKRGAHNKQYIIVSPDCFKELCMHVGTSRSKEIKKYYIELEKIFKFYLQYQSKYQELENKKIQEELENKDKELTEEKKKNIKHTFRLIQERLLELNEYIYIAASKNSAELNRFKIGMTKYIDTRISNYNTGRSDDDEFYYIYIMKCYDCESLEKMIFSRLSHFQYIDRHGKKGNEMYQIHYDTLIQIFKEFEQFEFNNSKNLNILFTEYYHTYQNIEPKKFEDIKIDNIQEHVNKKYFTNININTRSKLNNQNINENLKSKGIKMISNYNGNYEEEMEFECLSPFQHKFKMTYAHMVSKKTRACYYCTKEGILDCIKLYAYDTEYNFIKCYESFNDIKLELPDINHQLIKNNIREKRWLCNINGYIFSILEPENNKLNLEKELNMYENNIINVLNINYETMKNKLLNNNFSFIYAIDKIDKKIYYSKQITEMGRVIYSKDNNKLVNRKTIKKYINTNNTYAGYLWSTNIQLDNYVNYEIIDLK
jgi:hypothetical protein